MVPMQSFINIPEKCILCKHSYDGYEAYQCSKFNDSFCKNAYRRKGRCDHGRMRSLDWKNILKAVFRNLFR